jgi:hypothetical protein
MATRNRAIVQMIDALNLGRIVLHAEKAIRLLQRQHLAGELGMEDVKEVSGHMLKEHDYSPPTTRIQPADCNAQFLYCAFSLGVSEKRSLQIVLGAEDVTIGETQLITDTTKGVLFSIGDWGDSEAILDAIALKVSSELSDGLYGFMRNDDQDWELRGEPVSRSDSVWFDRYKPIPNISGQEGYIVDDVAYLFSPSRDEDMDFVKTVLDEDPRRVWTFVESDSDEAVAFIIPGFMLVNAEGYLITEHPALNENQEFIYD